MKKETKTRTRKPQTKVKGKKKKPFSHTDTFYKDLYGTLADDFRETLGLDFCLEHEIALREDVAKFRQMEYSRGNLSPYYFYKAEYQMENLLKRVKFENDMYTEEQLLQASLKKFVDTQIRIAKPLSSSTRARAVIKAARKHVKRILGDYSLDEHVNACRFGKRASVGSPFSEAYLDRKIGTALTGSPEHIAWFEENIVDNQFQQVLDSCVPMALDKYQPCDCLKLIAVPKSWKALRMIMPNTTIGSFYTYGLGKVIQSRLVSEGLNIRYLQRRHRKLVKYFSKSRTHATADLSSASDSFTIALVMALLPRKWWNVIKYGRIPNVEIDGKVTHLTSFMTMGNGYTFQLQTLLFYCILKGIQDLSHCKGLISVYGDDLIYPSTMHRYVSQVLPELGFILNKEKTFVKENFRESCGADYFCGVDVRPFSPEAEPSGLSKLRYLSVLYKTYNGLLHRWCEEEIPLTIRYLKREILRCTDAIHYVPHDFPDYAGIRTKTPQGALVRSMLHGNHMFEFLSMSGRGRPVLWQLPYYWDALRKAVSTVDDWNPFEEIQDSTSLQWKRVDLKFSWRSPHTGRRFAYRLIPVCADKRSDKVIISYSSCYTWNRSTH